MAEEKKEPEGFSFPRMEEEVISFWNNNNIFEKSVQKRKSRGKKSRKEFIFFEGPPTANGKPGVHHVEARSFKDIILRYKTMRGYHVPRRAGWDTHGLPVEVEVEKDLGLRSKKDIEEYGVAAFNKKCRESVWQYKELWEKMTDRMGFWIDMKKAYVTYENSYIESLWWIIKEFAKNKFLYEDFKVLPWCARCGTALSSHELAQGYEKIKEESVYVKFPVKGGGGKLSFLAWTTTPWALPGNTALAVNPDINYVFAKIGDETLILAESRIQLLDEFHPEILKKVKGSELKTIEYEALYPLPEVKYRVVTGDFVSVADGSGIVHIAPAFGDDDFQLSRKVTLSILFTTGEDGRMITPGKPWDGKKFKEANPVIIENLKERGLLFKIETYEHDYPFCWRCKSPLMYFARKAWWVDVNKVRPKLIANNDVISWHPEHIKHGRFGEWLKEEKNWAFSRERYWGTPLPVWRCAACGEWEALGSIAELKKRSVVSGNRYIIMRHGQAENNVLKLINSDLSKNHYKLTPKGKKEIETSIKKLKKQKIKPDVIFASPFLRTKQTAEMVAEALGVSAQNIKFDARLGEVNTGIFANGFPGKYHEYFANRVEKFTKTPPDGENLTDIKKRFWAAISEAEAEYKNKTILVVSHEYTLWMAWTAFLGYSDEESSAEKEKRGKDFLKTAEFMEVELSPIPRDENLILDLHKPYIDGVKLTCRCGGEMARVKEVVDVWFDSGSMPFAQDHYPFDTNKPAYPADYITEAVDQTRGWFYNLLAVGTLLGKDAPYKNVISLGHVLDTKGKKMSKSLGNIVEPLPLIEKYGADPVRWYFFTINQPGDPKLFKEDDIKDTQRRFFMIFWNIFQFWKLYSSGRPDRHGAVRPPKTNLLINQWVLTRLSAVQSDVTGKLEAYDIVGAARALESFVTEDVSRWYVRRIRGAIKDPKKSKEIEAVLRHLLSEISKLLAPFAPFISEKVWLELGNKQSVHLEDWPSINRKIDAELIGTMGLVKTYAAIALKMRSEKNIRVRQPLKRFSIKHSGEAPKYWNELKDILKDEINVKEVILEKNKSQDESPCELDINITPELRDEGMLRDFIREIQAERKKAGLTPKDKVNITLEADEEISRIVRKNMAAILKEVSAKDISVKISPEKKITFGKH
ncbi:class I tRNA ligase family protein [Candidatus Giovannonibacteria bacterium]|nr:class I tRNA ligase family protein [Candidatus Giovannonibacteria bacterium]